ncbi:MAG: HNH endonuclease [Gammaproteobacteria bacterium]|nr:HNH endonuclease [Gammaproteobacteria bacterium]
MGRPHNGDDSTNNLLCLCPNHHVLFDKGMFSIADDLTLLGSETGKLTIKPSHNISLICLKYHRDSHGFR